MIERKDVDNLSQSLSTLSARAQNDLGIWLDELWSKNLPRDVERELILQKMVMLNEQYGGMAAQAGSLWYSDLRDKQDITGNYVPDAFEVLDEKSVKKFARMHLGELYGDQRREDLARQKLLQSLHLSVTSAGRGTVQKATVSDPQARGWARVPAGKETCAFCDMLASRGFVYSSSEAAGKKQRFHDKCDCQIVPSWNKGDHRIQGYDPEALKASYDAARDAVYEKLGPTVVLDEKQILREMKIQDPDRYGFKGQMAGDLPFDLRKPVKITESMIDHIWDGEKNPKKGGHRPGLGREKKTEFPPHWNREMVESALREMYWYGKYDLGPDGKSYQVFSIIDDFLLQGWIHSGNVAGGAYPRAGVGIIRNENGKQVPQPLTEDLKEGVPSIYGTNG